MQIVIRRRRAFEVAVVLAVVVVALAVILSNTLGIRDRSRSAAAQALARNALMVQRSHFYGSGTYADAETLRKGEPAVDAVEEVAVLGKVYVRSDGYSTELASSTPDGTCYWIRDTSGVATYAKTSCDVTPGDKDFAVDGW